MQLEYNTNRLILKVLNEQDAPKVLNFYVENHEYFKTFEPTRYNNFYTLAFQQTALRYEYQQMFESKSLRFYVFEKNNPNVIIGTICLSNILRGAFLSCQIGYKFDHKHQKQGYATESLRQCIDIAFHEYNLHRIEACIMPSNLSSLHLIEKAGFIYEGISLSYANINGAWEDHLRYSLLNEEKA